MASLAVSHELIYLLAHGPGVEYTRAMREGGHDRYWTSFILTVVGVALVLAFVAVRQIRRLRRQASLARAGRLDVTDGGLGLLARLTGRLFVSVGTGTATAFFLQENLETVTAGHPLPGLGVVAGEHAIALLVIGLASLVVALVGALFLWGRHVLLARLRRAALHARRRPVRASRPSSTTRPSPTGAVRAHGLRAPPRLVSSSA